MKMREWSCIEENRIGDKITLSHYLVYTHKGIFQVYVDY